MYQRLRETAKEIEKEMREESERKGHEREKCEKEREMREEREITDHRSQKARETDMTMREKEREMREE